MIHNTSTGTSIATTTVLLLHVVLLLIVVLLTSGVPIHVSIYNLKLLCYFVKPVVNPADVNTIDDICIIDAPSGL